MDKLNTKTSEEKAHAEYSASGSERWLNCPGSIKLSIGVPPPPSNKYAEEGTQAHACFEFILNNFNHLKKHGLLREANSNKNWNNEMISHALIATEYVIDRMAPTHKLFVETKVNASRFTKEGQFGTLDVGLANYSARRLIIIDYKYGAGIPVDPENNSQLIYYALGMLLKLGIKKFDAVELVVIQPRAQHESGNTIREWVTTPQELIKWGYKFKKAVKLAETKDAPLKYGEKWCRYCPAKMKCPEFRNIELNRAKLDFDVPVKIEKQLPDIKKVEDIGKLLSACEKLETFIEAVREHAFSEASRGNKVNGFKLVERRSTRKWKNETLVGNALKKHLGDKAFSEPKLLSPAQIELKFKKLKSIKKFVEKNVSNHSSGLTLVKVSDKRKEISNAYEADFTIVDEE